MFRNHKKEKACGIRREVAEPMSNRLLIKTKAPFGSISNMTNPVGICSYCRIDPQAPCGSMSARSTERSTDSQSSIKGELLFLYARKEI